MKAVYNESSRFSNNGPPHSMENRRIGYDTDLSLSMGSGPIATKGRRISPAL